MAGNDDWTQPRRGLDVLPATPDEEVANVGTRRRGVGFVRAKKRVDTLKVSELIVRGRERVGLERVPVEEGDGGGIETLADGSISIPVYEERLVVTKEVVLTERVVIRKHLETVEERVQDELRKERVEIEANGDVEWRDSRCRRASWRPRQRAARHLERLRLPSRLSKIRASAAAAASTAAPAPASSARRRDLPPTWVAS